MSNTHNPGPTRGQVNTNDGVDGSGSWSRRHDEGRTNAFPATGMSTYYSAGKGSSIKSTGSSSPSLGKDKQELRASGSISYGSISSTSSYNHADSPASTVSSAGFASDTSGEVSIGSSNQSNMPKYRTVVKISNDSDRDKLFPKSCSDKETLHEGDHVSDQLFEKHRTHVQQNTSDSANVSDDKRKHGRHGRSPHCDRLSPGVLDSTAQKQTTAKSALLGQDIRNGCERQPQRHLEARVSGTVSRDQHRQVIPGAHNIKSDGPTEQDKLQNSKGGKLNRTSESVSGTPVCGDNCTRNLTVIETRATNMDIAHSVVGSGGVYYENHIHGNTNGIITHNGIDNEEHGTMALTGPPLPPRKPYNGSLATNHAQTNGSTGVPSDVSDSLDSDTSSINQDTSSFGFAQHKFHMDHGVPVESDGEVVYDGSGTTGAGNDKDVHPFLEGQRDVLKPNAGTETKIMSAKGTVRGLKNLVRAGIATFAEKKEGSKNYRLAEKGKVIVYTTSVKIVRETFEKCIKVKNILQTHMVKFEERDIFMSRENHRELNERLDSDNQDVPQVFADGQHIGGLEEIEKMNESGELRTIFKQFQRVSRTTSCGNCGGYRFVPCTACHGSKKSNNRNYFTEEFFALRCTNCDENGLVRCDICEQNDVTSS